MFLPDKLFKSVLKILFVCVDAFVQVNKFSFTSRYFPAFLGWTIIE